MQNKIEGEIALLVGKQKHTGVGGVCLGKKKTWEPVSKSANLN